MRPPTNQPANQHLSALTGLRIVAALHVVLYHFGRELFAGGPAWLANIVNAGYIGVSLFYILSGFIMTYVYLDANATKRVNRRSFWLARVARVYPVYLVGLLLWTPFFIDKLRGGILPPFTAIATAITAPTATQAWLPNTACEWNCPSWSVSVEAFFYFLFPFIAATLFVRIDTWKMSRALLIMAGIWILSLLPPLTYVIAERSGEIQPGAHTWLDFLKFNPLVRTPEFLLGIVLGKFFLTNAAQHTRGEKWATLLSLVAVAGITLALLFSPSLPYPLLHNGLLAPLFALLIYALALGKGPVVWLLSRAPIVFLGEASYALYILHAPIWDWFYKWQVQLGLGIDVGHSVVYFLVYLAALLIASITVFKLLEIPARDAIKRIVGRKPGGAPEARRGIGLLKPVVGALLAVAVVGLGSGVYSLVRPTHAASDTVPVADPGAPASPVGAIDPRGNLLRPERLAPGLETSGWRSISGQWNVENGALVQRQAEGYDHMLAFAQTFSDYVYQVGFRHLQGSGGGVIFNMPEASSKNGAHMVRYNDEGTGVFWGYYDQNGDFTGQGFAPTLPQEKKAVHVLRVHVGADTYAVLLDGRTLAENVPLMSKQGHIGLHSSVSVVSFDSAEVVGSNDQPLAAGAATNGASPAAASLAMGDNLLSSLSTGGNLEAAGWTSFSGEWAFTDGALTQSERTGFDRGIGYQGTFSDYTLSTTLRHLEGTGGGVLFNMPQPDRKNGAHMVRFSEDGKAVFWGYYDANGDFTGQGSGDVAAPGTEAHTIEIRVGTENYTVLVDGQTIVENVPLQSQAGHVGLTSSESVVAFESVQVKPAIE